jgi:predicted nucleic acid-binding protein
MTRGAASLDSNALIYTVSAGDPRQFAAQRLVRLAATGGGLLTMQALGEFYHVSPRKGFVTRAEAAAQVRRWLAIFPTPPAPTVAALEAALAASVAGRFAYWDALLLTTAAEAGCAAVISEDMAPGATLGPIRVVPAFAGDAPSPEALAVLGAAA